MRLRVLGRSSPYAGPGEATVGYVVEGDASSHILLECGSGVIAKYLQQYSLADLAGVIISHLHPDHCADLFPLGFAIKHAQMQGLRARPVPLFLPLGSTEIFNEVLVSLGDLEAHYGEVFAYCEYQAHHTQVIGEWKAHFHKVYHGMNCHGVVLEGIGGELLGYTGDTKMGPQLAEFFQENDLLLCEATVESEEQGQKSGHLTAEQAGMLGATAGVGLLLLTHFLPGTDEGVKKRLAARHYCGEIGIAEEGVVYCLKKK